MKNVQVELEKALAPEIRNKVVELKARREGLIVSLREIGFYEIGSAALRPTSKDAIDRLAAVLASRTEALRIEGTQITCRFIMDASHQTGNCRPHERRS